MNTNPKPTVEELQAILDGPDVGAICCPDGRVRIKSEIPYGFQIRFYTMDIGELTKPEGEARRRLTYAMWNGEKWIYDSEDAWIDVCNEMARRLDVLWKHGWSGFE